MIVGLRDVFNVNRSDLLVIVGTHPAYVTRIRPQLFAGLSDPLVQH